MPAAELRTIRGRRIAMIFQDPMTSLNPYLSIETQMVAAMRAHERLSFKAARARCLEMLNAVAIPEPAVRLQRYPHELSGGMRQRVMIATSLLLEPEVLVADEPTTALDVTVQAQILALLKDLKRRFNTAIVLITHDLGVVAGLADRVLVMHGGERKEQGDVRDVFYRPQHEYTRMLLKAVPRLDSAQPAAPPPAQTDTPLLTVETVRVHFPVPGAGWFAKREVLRAVDGVDLKLAPGETLGVVGESGSGKSTLARAILRLAPATAGSIAVLGRDLAALSPAGLRAIKRNLQVVFQDPLAALNPRMNVGDIVSEPLWTHRPELDAAAVKAEVVEVLRRVGLTGRELNRYPHEFSGGQCQRIGIARALVLKPKVIICDEPVSALDVSIQREIVQLLARAAARVRPRARLHCPRSRRRAAIEPSRDGHVFGPRHGGRESGRSLHAPAPSLHAGPHERRAAAGSRRRARARPRRAARRAAVADPPAERLPVQDALPVRDRTLCGGDAGLEAVRERARGVPPRRGARRREPATP